MKKTALIMAGGRGERFWPRSRKKLPKQFLSLTDDGKTMLQLTVERLLPIVDLEDIFIATNKDYYPLVMEQLPKLPPRNIICEPMGRNTAPCIALGAAHISKKYEEALMLVLPSDHLIKLTDIFQETLRDACLVAEQDDNIVTVGIKPQYPETGYGYIKFLKDKRHEEGKAYKVDRFVEKPDLERAREYLASGEYLWNSGMFLWKLSTILSKFKDYMPEIYPGLEKIRASIGGAEEKEVLESCFLAFPSISVDYGIMEKAENIYTLPGDFGWDDVGSWLALERVKSLNDDGNVVDGNVVTINSRDCIIQAGDKLIAAVGLENTVIVDTEDATLICNKEKTADIKKLLEEIKNKGMDQYV
ncbi:MAG: NTP transferase domain-containing protein [Lachnospiraceae bacterium]|nr:NTP transferase domain-containing protein [Lachnospiraceae bacterium]